MIEYRKAKVTRDDKLMKDLLTLSRAWADEHTCPSYYANEPSEFIEHSVYIAADQGRVVAYALGNIIELKEKTSYNEIGEKSFELDELYVVPEYRDRGIGRALYRFIEDDVRDKVDLMGVIATSYEYEKLLRFYVKDLDMSFNHALLVKRMHD